MALFGSKERKNAKKVEEAWELLNSGRTDKAVSKISMVAIGGYAPAEYLMAVAAWKMGNIKDAVFWRKSAAEKGVADAQQLLEQLQDGNAGSTDKTRLLDSYYDNKDWANAAKLATEMTVEGDSYAANLLANMYYAGNGVKQDYAKALELYKQSAQRGYVGGVANLGRFYDNAEGYKDPAKATEYHIQAAEKGRPSAMYRLGKAYENGSGITQDMDKAVLWYYKAQQRGNTMAEKRLKEIRDEMCHSSIERKEFDWMLQQLVEKDKSEREEKQRLEQQKKEQDEEAARRQAEEKARFDAEMKAKAEAEEKARIEAETRAKAEAEEKARIEAEQKAEEEEKARLKAELKAKIEAQVRAEMEAEIKAKVEAEMKAKAEAEEKARIEADMKAKADARRYGEEMINRARSLCAGGDFENGEKVVRQLLAEQPDNRSAQHLLSEIEDVKAYDAQQAAEKAAKEEAERKAQAEAEEKARLEAEMKAKAKAEEKAKLAAQQAEKQKNTDEIFTSERLQIMERVALQCTEKHKKEFPYDRQPADEELDWAEEAYRKGDYEKAYHLRAFYEGSSVRATNMVGAMQLTGRGTKKDGAAALKNFKRAAKLDYPPACYNMGMMYLQWDADDRALNMFEKGAEGGNIKCMLKRSEVYLKGLGRIEVSPADGYFWLQNAAKAGDLAAAKQVVELFYTQPEYTSYIYMYLKLLADAGDNEICARAAQILSTGVEGKMKPLPMPAEYFTNLLKSREPANTAASDSTADEAEKNDIIKRAGQLHNMSADQLGSLRRLMLGKDMADEADQITEYILDNRWFDIWYDLTATGSAKSACEKWEKYKDAVDKSTYSQHFYRLDAAHHFALKAETLSLLETDDEDDDTAWVIGGTVISGAFVPDMLLELANADETVMVLDPYDNYQMAMLNKNGLLQITEDAMVGDERYFIIHTPDGQQPQIDSDSLITYFHEYDMAEELYCPVLDYSYDISQIKQKDMIFVHYFKELYNTVKTPAEKGQVMNWLDRKFLDAAKMHIRNDNPVSATYIVNAVLDYFPEYDAAKLLKKELSALMD